MFITFRTYAYIGLWNLSGGNVHTDGSEKADFLVWYPGKSGLNAPSCIELKRHSNILKMYPLQCSAKRHFVCEVENGAVPGLSAGISFTN